MDESQPETQADSGMNPPPRVPPVALATAEEPPYRGMVPTPAGPRDFTVLVNRALDQLDTIADRIARATGLR
jgi:hypothetical protein